MLVYWGAITLGPLIFALSLTATSYAVSASRGLIGGMPRGFGFAVGTIEYLLEAVSVAALTVYDMCKAVDRRMVIDQVRLEEKTGGRGGHFRRDADEVDVPHAGGE